MHLPSPALRCCLLSGGLSRRMGRDKALLPHPNGGTWLEHTLRLLGELDAPITLLTRWSSHQALAEGLRLPQLETLSEPPPWEGPLLALHRLMEQHPNEQLLLCPVDMPNLNAATLRSIRIGLTAAVQAGERRLQSWLDTQTSNDVLLCPATIRNINHPDEL